MCLSTALLSCRDVMASTQRTHDLESCRTGYVCCVYNKACCEVSSLNWLLLVSHRLLSLSHQHYTRLSRVHVPKTSMILLPATQKHSSVNPLSMHYYLAYLHWTPMVIRQFIPTVIWWEMESLHPQNTGNRKVLHMKFIELCGLKTMGQFISICYSWSTMQGLCLHPGSRTLSD